MLKRVVAVIGLSALTVVASALPAAAKDPWGSVECGQNPYPGCELGAESGSRPAPAPGGDDAKVPDTGSGKPNGEEVKNPNPDLNRAKCSYRRSGYKPPAAQQAAAYHGLPGDGGEVAQAAVFTPHRVLSVAEPAAGPKPGEKGAWYVYKCEAGGVRDGYFRPPVWLPDGEPGNGPGVSVAELARQARDQLRLPSPQIDASPAGEQLVKLPTWLWLERGSWRSGSATASAPGVSVTAVARPRWVKWSMGDGRSVRCTGRGTPYESNKSSDPKSASPDCGYTYRSSSAGKPSDAYRVSATVHWSVTWSGAGQTGTFADLTTTSSAAFRVAESQAVNTDD